VGLLKKEREPVLPSSILESEFTTTSGLPSIVPSYNLAIWLALKSMLV
jgi:hypothetical protein